MGVCIGFRYNPIWDCSEEVKLFRLANDTISRIKTVDQLQVVNLKYFIIIADSVILYVVTKKIVGSNLLCYQLYPIEIPECNPPMSLSMFNISPFALEYRISTPKRT